MDDTTISSLLKGNEKSCVIRCCRNHYLCSKSRILLSFDLASTHNIDANIAILPAPQSHSVGHTTLTNADLRPTCIETGLCRTPGAAYPLAPSNNRDMCEVRYVFSLPRED